MLYSKGNNYCPFCSHEQHIKVLWGAKWFLQEVIRTEANVIYSAISAASTWNSAPYGTTFCELQVEYNVNICIALSWQNRFPFYFSESVWQMCQSLCQQFCFEKKSQSTTVKPSDLFVNFSTNTSKQRPW